MKFSRKEQDQIMNDISITEEEIIRLKLKQSKEGLSSPEYHTLQMLEKRLRRLRQL